MATNQTLHNSLRDILKDLDPHRKQAAAKSAEPMSEPGSQGGATENPIKGIDDSLIPEETGSRYAENTSDSKKMTGPAGVESTPDRKPGQSTQDKRQYAIGVTSKATGEDPKNEDNYKSDKDDPGTTAPMTTDDGKKYGSADLAKLASDFSALANPLLAEIVAGGLQPKAAGAQVPQGSQAAAQAAADGYKAASGGPSDDDIAQAVLGEVIKEAVISADAVITFLDEFNKRASDPAAAADAENHDGPGDAASGASEGPAAPAGGPPGVGAAPDAGGGEGSIEELIPLLASLPPDQKAQIMAALGGDGGDGGAGGGLPPMGPPPGGPAAGGAPPPDAASMPVMSDAMADMGATPAGLEGEAAKMASANPAAAGMLRKLAAAVRDYRDSGRWHYKPATDRKTAAARLEAQRLINELLGRN